MAGSRPATAGWEPALPRRRPRRTIAVLWGGDSSPPVAIVAFRGRLFRRDAESPSRSGIARETCSLPRTFRYAKRLGARLQRGRLPGHEIVERLACSRDGESDDGGVIEKTKERNFIGNKIERIDQIADCGDDKDESVLRNVPVFAAKIGPDQPQHRL